MPLRRDRSTQVMIFLRLLQYQISCICTGLNNGHDLTPLRNGADFLSDNSSVGAVIIVSILKVFHKSTYEVDLNLLLSMLLIKLSEF